MAMVLGMTAITSFAADPVTTVPVHYNLNGGQGTIDDGAALPGVTFNLTSTQPTYEGYNFAGWSLTQADPGTYVATRTDVTVSDEITVYAVWTPAKLTLTYDANGGTGTAPDAYTANLTAPDVSATVSLASGDNLSKENYEFSGWATIPNGGLNDVKGNGGDNFTFGANTTLYAVWTGRTPATADTYGENSTHTLTINNSDQNVEHSYKIYQVFSGNLDRTEGVLSDIAWGNGVDGDALLTALKGTDDPLLLSEGESIFKDCETATDVAKVIETLQGTSGANQSAGALDAVATIIADNVTSTEAATITGSDPYTASGIPDGYYIVLDVTEKLTADDGSTGSDTRAKHMLQIVTDTAITAKDTGITPDKEIVEGSAKVKAGDAAIGDEVKFEVVVEVPNTKKYEKKFIFNMTDQLPEGLTFTGIESITAGSVVFEDAKAGTENAADTTGTDTAYYTLFVNDAFDTYAYKAEDFDPVAAEGGQTIKIVFNNFKAVAEANNLVGATPTEELHIIYTAVVNDDAKYQGEKNENEVTFNYSNNPNHDYTGENDDFTDDEKNDTTLSGTSPKSTTRTYTTSIKLKKTDENGAALAGATFKLTGTALNRTVITGDKYELTTYVAKDGETIHNDKKYYLLRDGSYTDTDPASVAETTQYANPGTDEYKTYVRVTYRTNTGNAFKYEESGYTLQEGDVEIQSGVTYYKRNGSQDYTTDVPTSYVKDEKGAYKVYVHVTGDGVDKYELQGYEAAEGETIAAGTFYLEDKENGAYVNSTTAIQYETKRVDKFAEYYRVSYTKSEITPDATKNPLILTSDADGIIEFIGLKEGTYTLEEINAPDGYNKIDGTSDITISWSDPGETDAESIVAQGGFTLSATDFANAMKWNADEKQFEVTIENHTGSTLPSTGGIGTTIFYVVGAILVIGAGVVLITKRRMDA